MPNFEVPLIPEQIWVAEDYDNQTSLTIPHRDMPADYPSSNIKITPGELVVIKFGNRQWKLGLYIKAHFNESLGFYDEHEIAIL